MNAKDIKRGLHSTLGITIYLNSTFDKFDIDEFPMRMKKGFLLHFSTKLNPLTTTTNSLTLTTLNSTDTFQCCAHSRWQRIILH